MKKKREGKRGLTGKRNWIKGGQKGTRKKMRKPRKNQDQTAIKSSTAKLRGKVGGKKIIMREGRRKETIGTVDVQLQGVGPRNEGGGKKKGFLGHRKGKKLHPEKKKKTSARETLKT